MATINSSQKGYGFASNANYTTARTGNALGVFNSQTGLAAYAAGYRAFDNRGTDTHAMYRSFFGFDTSGITSSPTSATITINGTTGS